MAASAEAPLAADSAGRDPWMSRPLLAALALLAAFGALYLAWPVWRAFFPLDIDRGEAWNAFHADSVVAGRPLYPAPSSLVTNNYPPLSFYLVAAIASATVDAVYVGRMLSIAATIASALAAAALLRQLGASRAAAALAGLWFLATLARFFAGYVGMNDPNLVALAIMAWALVWLMRRLAGGRTVAPAILLMAAAGFYKHNVVAIPLTALLWLGLVDRRQAARAAIVGAGAVALGFTICGLVWGGDFFAQLLSPRIYRWAHVWGGLGRLQWIAPALVIFAVLASQDWKHAPTRFVALLTVTAFVFQCVQKLGDGVADNAQFELAFAAAVGLGLAFDRIDAWPAARRFGSDRSRLAIVAILLLRLLASTNTVPYRVVASGAFRALVREHAAIAVMEIARIRAIPGDVVCTIEVVCRLAGKSFQLDGYNIDQKIQAGRLTRDEVDRAIAERNLRFEPVDPRASAQFQ
jgi:hypothetical protein